MANPVDTLALPLRRRIVLAVIWAIAGQGLAMGAAPQHRYGLAVASFAPLDTDLFIADADGSNAHPIGVNPALDSNASFSPDGRWLIFSSTRNGSSDLYRMHVDGSHLEQLTDDPAFDDQGALSPDGKLLAFVSSRSGQADIWVLDLKSKVSRNITAHAGGDFRPAWSPDGQWIAFSSDRDSSKPRISFSTLHSTELYLVRGDGSGLRRVTHANAFAGSPAWSPDGKWLVFYEASIDGIQKITSPRRLRGTTQIARINQDGSGHQVLTDGEGEKWSPCWISQHRIGYASGGPEGGIQFIVDGEGAAAARGEMRNPVWSPDGKRLVFQREVGTVWPPVQLWNSLDARFPLLRTGIFPSFSPRTGRLLVNDRTAGALHNSILVMDADGGRRSILFQEQEKSALAPAWSPNGDHIAFGLGGFFQAATGPSIADIAVMQADGTQLRVLTDGSGNFGFPSWSPDAKKLVYRSAGKDNNGLWIVDVETGKTTALAQGGGHENFPSWSPDGERIAFTSDQGGDYEIYTVKTDGTALRRLTDSPGNDAHNVWSPDGNWIVFTSARGGFKDEAALHPYNPQPYGDLYVMRPDGSEVTRITDDQFEEGTPGWFLRK